MRASGERKEGERKEKREYYLKVQKFFFLFVWFSVVVVVVVFPRVRPYPKYFKVTFING